jgi:hypothetical protein
VITHWTVGRYTASEFEREHYHFLIEGDGRVVRGDRSISDNVNTSDGVYAAHTLNANQGSIGVCACCMAGSVERPFQPGKFPMTEKQYLVMAQVVAELCEAYDIPVTTRTVLGHGEVQVNLGIKQRGKWDPMILPWNTELSSAEVGTYFRSLVARALEGEPNDEDEVAKKNAPVLVKARVKGKNFTDAVLDDGSSYLPIYSLAKALGWKSPQVTGDKVIFVVNDKIKHTLPLKRLNANSYVSANDLAIALGTTPAWDKATRTVIVD